jgi:hypothetical protein
MVQHGTACTPAPLAAKLIDYRFKNASEGTGKAYRAGVRIIYGTDLGIFGPERSHEEFGLLAAAGLPPAQVLRAATVNAATALGWRGNDLGSITVGRTADIIAMRVRHKLKACLWEAGLRHALCRERKAWGTAIWSDYWPAPSRADAAVLIESASFCSTPATTLISCVACSQSFCSMASRTPGIVFTP